MALRSHHDPVELGRDPFSWTWGPRQARGMTETFLPWSLTLIGLAALGAGAVGTTLPSGRRIEALLALVAGAGAGLAVLGIGAGAGLEGPSPEGFDRLFFVASLAGTLAVAVVLARLWRRPQV